MHIIHIASEMTPFAKVGGLADVLQGLSRELIQQGHIVDVVLPHYDNFKSTDIQYKERDSCEMLFGQEKHTITIEQGYYGIVPLHLLTIQGRKSYFKRGKIYGCEDDIERFFAFCKAALAYLIQTKKIPDIIHLHDWVTSAVVLLLQLPEYRIHFAKTKVVFTIHNIAYQGLCSTNDIENLGTFPQSFFTKNVFEDEHSVCLNLLKGAIVLSDAIVTVSPTYAQEVLSPDGGKGLDLVLRKNQQKFFGILNGLDTAYWDPAHDPALWYNYSVHTNCTISHDTHMLSNKIKNKKRLYEILSMTYDEKKPLIVSISRLVAQKGVDLIQHAFYKLVHEYEAQCIILGTASDPIIEREFQELCEKYSTHPDGRILLINDEEVAHRLYAAADIVLVPSLFEPCGLTQMIALRYGALPVVRKTGGLADTVFDVDFASQEKANGFTFDFPDYQGVEYAIRRAVNVWKKEPKIWESLMCRAMTSDLSWKESAKKYVELYDRILQQEDVLVKG